MTYEAFLEDYQRVMAALPGTVNLPNGYLQNWRGWDYYQIYQHGNLNPYDLMLDVGAFHTFGCLYWTQYVRYVFAVDNFYWAARACNCGLMTAYEWQCVVEKSRLVTVRNEDAQQLSFQAPFFEKVICVSTIEHILDDCAALRELYRVTHPGGKLMLTTEYHDVNGKPYDEADGSFYRVYNRETLAALLEGYPVTALVIDVPREPFTTAFVCIEKGME